MQPIETSSELKAAIHQLERKQAGEWLLLQAQFLNTYESLKPARLIRSTLKELTSAPGLKGNILDATFSLAMGSLTKDIAVGATHNPFKYLFGALLQTGVTRFVSKNTDGIKAAASHLINSVFGRKESPPPAVQV